MCYDSFEKNNEFINDTVNFHDDEIAKWYRYIYNSEKGLCYFKQNSKKSILIPCVWIDNAFQKLLSALCEKLFKTNKLKNDIIFFSQFNHGNHIYRADPNFENNVPWYDWAEIKWGEQHGILPAKLLLFIDITPQQFNSKIIIDNIVIDKPGKYAIIQSIFSTETLMDAHQISLLCKYGKFEVDNPLYIVPVSSIYGPISAVPYKVKDNIMIANDWLFLRPKNEWYKIFFEFINSNITTNDKKRKR